MVNLGDSLTANINKANDLAVANGKAGASAQDIGKIIGASVMQGVAAIRALQQESENLARSLFGARQKSDLQDIFNMMGAAKQAQAQQFTQAATLLGDLSQLGTVTGSSLTELATMFDIPLAKLAKMLGTDQAGLSKEFTQQEAMARAALDTAGNTKYTNELLADILAANQGHPLPFSTEQLAEDATGTITPAATAGGGKPGGPGTGAKPPGFGGAQPASVATVATVTSPDVTGAVSKNTDSMTRHMGLLIGEVRQLRLEMKAVRNRNERA